MGNSNSQSIYSLAVIKILIDFVDTDKSVMIEKMKLLLKNHKLDEQSSDFLNSVVDILSDIFNLWDQRQDHAFSVEQLHTSLSLIKNLMGKNMEVYAESMTLYKSQQTQNSGEQKMHIQISNSFLLNLQTNMINLLQILTTSFKKLVNDETSFKNNSVINQFEMNFPEELITRIINQFVHIYLQYILP